MFKIGLDAGHGLRTSGKQTPNGIKEWEINDKVRDKEIAIFKDYDVEIINVDNNEGNIDESLTSRRNMYINAKVNVFISNHHNANRGKWGKHTGIEVYVDRNATKEDLELAQLIHDKLAKYTGLKGRGVKRANFTVINQNKVTAVLVEGGFMDSTIDYPVITSDKGQEAYARAVAESVIEYYGLTKKQNVPQKTNPTNTTAATTKAKYKVGDKVIVSSYYASSTDPVEKAVHKVATGTITKVLTNGARNKYLLNNGALGWCNDGDIRGFANTASSKPLSVGSKVKIKSSAKKYCTGQTIKSSLKGKPYTVKQIGTTRFPNGVLLLEIMSWVNREDLEY